VAVRDFLAGQGMGQDELVACELALVEACNNAVGYAPESARHEPVGIQILCEATAIEIQVIDHTAGFELPAAADLPAPDAEHGRGLFIIQAMMDEVVYLRGSIENRLVMRKRRTSQQQSPQPEVPDVHARLALNEDVIRGMVKELCFRSEELAAIFRCTSELGKNNNPQEFSRRLLGDLLHITAADWFILRLLDKDGSKLLVTNSSLQDLKMEALCIPTRSAPLNDSEEQRVSHEPELPAEQRVAAHRIDVIFGPAFPLSENDPIILAQPCSSGVVRPIVAGDTLLGTLVVGRDPLEPPFTVEQLEVIHTFSDFLAIQLINARFQQEHMDLRLTAHELDIARSIQQSLLPKTFPKLPGFGLGGFCLSARQVGGDFFDILPVADDRVLLVVADVMGKGVPAALFAATLHTLVRTLAEWTDRPAELLSRVNRLMYDELSGVDMFITAQVAMVDLTQGRLSVSSAGHCPILLANHRGEISTVSPEGMPLGIVPDVSFGEQIIHLEDCNFALLYTDGLTEARNAHGEFFGEERLLNWLRQQFAKHQSASQLAEQFKAELSSFQSQIALSDDQTFLILAQETAPAVASENAEFDGAVTLAVPERAAL